MSSFVLSQDIIDRYNKDGAVLIKGKNINKNRLKTKTKAVLIKGKTKTQTD